MRTNGKVALFKSWGNKPQDKASVLRKRNRRLQRGWFGFWIFQWVFCLVLLSLLVLWFCLFVWHWIRPEHLLLKPLSVRCSITCTQSILTNASCISTHNIIMSWGTERTTKGVGDSGVKRRKSTFTKTGQYMSECLILSIQPLVNACYRTGIIPNVGLF